MSSPLPEQPAEDRPDDISPSSVDDFAAPPVDSSSVDSPSVDASPVETPSPAPSWNAGETALEARAVRKHYRGGDGSLLTVLDGVDLHVGRGEAVSVIGRSGSGKSTLLQVLGGLDRPDAGEVHVGGRALAALNEEEGARVRNRSIGFVFQFHHLLREFTALENVMMPQLIGGTAQKAARERARELLAHVGLEGRLTHKPAQLSGGEQQRVAVARALANRPLVLLADEPSGNLDPETAEALHDLFFAVCADEGAALVLVTHDLALAARAGRVLRLHAGHLEAAPEPEPGLLD